MKIRLKLLEILLLVAGLGIAIGGGLQAQMPKPKGVLRMYVCADTKAWRVLLEGFNKAYPDIEVKWVRASAGKQLARIRAEAANPQASILYVGPSGTHIALEEDGLTVPYRESLAWQWMSDKFKDPDGYWSAMTLGIIGFVVNKNFLEEHKIEAPTSYQDLLKPEFKGELAMAYPYTSGTAYTTLATVIQLMGEAEGFEYFKKLDKQMHHYTESGSACIAEVGMGEIAGGIAFAHDIVSKGIWAGYPVEMSFPYEGTSAINAGCMSLIKGGPEPELAKIFYDWALSAEAQSLYKHHDVGYIPMNPESEVGEGVVLPEDVTLIEYDEEWAGKNKDRLIDRWREITGK